MDTRNIVQNSVYGKLSGLQNKAYLFEEVITRQPKAESLGRNDIQILYPTKISFRVAMRNKSKPLPILMRRNGVDGKQHFAMRPYPL